MLTKDRMKYQHRAVLLVVALFIFGCVAQSVCVAQVAQSVVKPQLPVIPARKFLLTDFGAKGDGKTLNTDAFRKAIAACRAGGGGEVVVPAGTFVTGPFALTDNLALVIERGATIRGSEDSKDYEKTNADGKTSVLPLIGGEHLTNVAIRGAGTIDGAGAA